MVDLAKVSFGAPAAERDISAGLVDYFVQSEAFERINSRKKTILLGNRGSGKSAIFKYIAHNEKKHGAIVIELTPENYSYEMFSTVLRKESEGSWVKFGAYAAAWKYLIYVLVMKHLIREGRKFKKGPSANIYNYLRDNHSGFTNNPISLMISYLKRIEGIKIGSFEAGLKSRELQKLYKLEDIMELIPDIKILCEKEKSVLIFVDELDRGWDASEDAKAFVAGLFQASNSINEVSKNLTVYISLRKEIYDSIPQLYDDIQKYRDIVEILSWNESTLLSLAAKRIKHSTLGLEHLDDKKVWNNIFLETLQYRKTNSFNYIAARTLYRPREIIQFCNTCLDFTKNKLPLDRFPIDYPVISSAELEYSKDRTLDLSSEYRFQYPGLLSLFETFRGMRYTIERSDLWNYCFRLSTKDILVNEDCFRWINGIEPDVLIKILWEIGFITAYIVGGLKSIQRQGSSYIGSHQITTINLDNIPRFQIHPMFRSFLSLKEK